MTTQSRPLPANGLRARAGLQAGDPERYSRFVVVMKRVLLFAALALILAVVAFSIQPRETARVSTVFARIGTLANDLAMTKPKLHGTDTQGNPFVITADSAVQDGASSKRAKLYHVQADIAMKKGAWVTASARQGYLDGDKNTLALWGDLSVFSDTGYELHTQEAMIDLTSAEIRGEHVITGQGPGGTLKADRFTLDRQGKAVHLMGHVEMSFFVHGAKHK